MAVEEINESVAEMSAMIALEPGDLVDDLRHPLESDALQCLSRTLEKAADALFDRSRREDSTSLRDSCLSAMRALRHHRQPIMESFERSLAHALDRGFAPAEASDRGAAARSRDELKEKAMVEGTITRVREQHAAVLEELAARLRSIVDIGPDGRQHPFGPDVIVWAFSEALRDTGIETRPRIVVYKAFESQLLASLGTLYQRLNRELAATGLPATGVDAGTEKADGRPETDKAASQALSEPTANEAPTAVMPEDDDGASTRQSPSETYDDARAAARIDVVRQHVKVAVESRLGRAPELPEFVARFLREAWSDVMLMTGVARGVHGEAWREQVRLMEWLIRSMRASDTGEERQKGATELAGLLEQLREQLDRVMGHDALIDDLVSRLRQAYADCHATAWVAQEEAPASERVSPDNVVVAAFGDGATSVAPTADSGDSAEQRVPDEAIEEALAEMPLGTWFEFVNAAGERTRARLQAGASGGQRYTFADGQGEVVSEYTHTELALAVEDGWVAPLDEPACGDESGPE